MAQGKEVCGNCKSAKKGKPEGVVYTPMEKVCKNPKSTYDGCGVRDYMTCSKWSKK